MLQRREEKRIILTTQSIGSLIYCFFAVLKLTFQALALTSTNLRKNQKLNKKKNKRKKHTITHKCVNTPVW